VEIGIMPNKLCLLVCRNYFSEINQVIQQEGFVDVTVKQYPQYCLKSRIPEKDIQTINSERLSSDNSVFLADNCLLKQTIDRNYSQVPQDLDHQDSHKPGHCLEMFANRELIEYFSRDGAYMVSPGWLAHWQSILEDWGFDQETAKMFFQECSTHIVLFETYSNPENNARLIEFTNYIDLPFQVVPIGLDHFRLMVSQMITEWRMKKNDGKTAESLNQVQQQLANYALAFDMLANLTRMMSEDNAVQEIINIFSMLFAPQEISYISMVGGNLNKVYPPQKSQGDAESIFQWAVSNSFEYHVSENIDGFYLRIQSQVETVGVIDVKHITFPQYCQQYLNMGLVLAPLCGLTISNARAYQIIADNEKQLQHLASVDSLTGLFNRRHFFDVAELEFKRAKRYNRPLSAIMIDIDFFKNINDTYSHAIGDRVLVELSRLLITELRESDIRARMGGEEFVVLLPETDLSLAQSLAERLRKNIADMVIDIEGKSVQITVSLGIACMDSTIKTLDDILHLSDLALYNAKRNGRNQEATWAKPI
jgi:diguanylate cyclase (GGDEF)-like protein